MGAGHSNTRRWCFDSNHTPLDLTMNVSFLSSTSRALTFTTKPIGLVSIWKVVRKWGRKVLAMDWCSCWYYNKSLVIMKVEINSFLCGINHGSTTPQIASDQPRSVTCLNKCLFYSLLPIHVHIAGYTNHMTIISRYTYINITQTTLLNSQKREHQNCLATIKTICYHTQA